MQFGLHLLKRGLIDADQLVEALEIQAGELPPLGQLAIEEGYLTAQEVFGVLRVQTDFVRDRFGETAIELQLLDRRQVAELLLIQGERRRPLGEVLVESGAIDPATYCEQERDYRAELEEQGALRATEITKVAIPGGITEEALEESPAPTGAQG